MFSNTAFAGRRTLSAARLTADLLSLRSGATAASFKPRCRVAHRPPPSGPVCQQIESGPYPHPISARPARPPDKQRWRRRVQAYRVTGQQPSPDGSDRLQTRFQKQMEVVGKKRPGVPIYCRAVPSRSRKRWQSWLSPETCHRLSAALLNCISLGVLKMFD